VSEIAEKRLIPIEQEIALCQHHIKIMKFRKEVDYSLECENIQSDESIPPAIFHTIIENGITHSLPDANNQIKMVLNFTETKEYKCYQLSTFAKNRKASEKREGTGLKYVKSRLEENYGSRWRLESEPVDFGWKTRVYILK
jgi:LytS/YehU family sensor histidine kinase